MDRQLLSEILAQMKKHLLDKKEIGDMKVGALLALGHQLEAIFYYLGHELGTILKVHQVRDVLEIPEALTGIIQEYHLGEVEIIASSEEIIQLKLRGHSSIKDLINKGIRTDGSFCAFEAGMLAGIVERMINFHCFAQEVNCSLQTGENFCEFMIVFQKD
jgi:predicted hydrocarbon binding protein